MKLTVLGGAAAGGNPGQGCSGYLVQARETSVVLDLGPGTLPELRLHTDFRTLDGIVVSHLHLDHILDLLALRYALAYNPRPAERRLPLWLPPAGVSFFERLADVLADRGEAEHYFDVYEMVEYDPSSEVGVGWLTIRFAPTVHYVPCWAMRVATTEGSGDLAYTADTGPAANLAAFVHGAAVMVAEAGAVETGQEALASRGHLTAVEATELANDAGADRLILTHFWHEEDPAGALRRASGLFKGEVLAARPGLVVEW